MFGKIKMRRWFWIPIPLLAIAVAALFLVQQGGRNEALADERPDSGAIETEKELPATPVQLAEVARREMRSHFSSTGTLSARRSVDLIAKVGGQIQRLAVEEGDVVQKGQLLLEIDHREQELLAGKAEVLAQTAQREYERVADIAKRGLATDKELETARQAAEVNGYEHQLAVTRLQDHIVRAPFSGIVTLRRVELGQTVNAGEQLYQLTESDPMELRLYLPESTVSQIQVGQSVAITPDVGPRSELTGFIERIAPAVDSATSTVKVTVGVEGSAVSMRPGSFVRAQITTDVHVGALSIPKRALLAEAGAQYVFVAEADSVRKLEVQTGYADADFAEVVSGLAEGERVVVVGHGGLRNGSRIRDIDAKPAPQSGEEDANAQTEVAR